MFSLLTSSEYHRLCYREWMPDNTTKINIGTHKSPKYNECIGDLFKKSTWQALHARVPVALSKTCGIRTVKPVDTYVDDVYVEAVY